MQNNDENRRISQKPGLSTAQHSLESRHRFVQRASAILVIGPWAGQDEFAARVWRDSRIALKKKGRSAPHELRPRRPQRMSSSCAPPSTRAAFRLSDDALAYRGGYERCGTGSDRQRFLQPRDAHRRKSGSGHRDHRRAAFFDERIAYP